MKGSGLSKIGAYRLICQYVMELWLARVAFDETVLHGLAKTYYMQ